MSIFEQRRAELVKLINQNEAVILLNSPKNIYYFTGFFSDPHERFMGLLWNEKVGWTLIVPKLDLHSASEVVDSSIQLKGYGDDQPASQLVHEFLATAQSNHILLEENILSYERIKWVFTYNQGMHIANVQGFVNQMRVSKSKEEQHLLKEVGDLTDVVLKRALERFQFGMTENDLVAEIEYQAKKAGAEEMSFGTTVLAGDKSALPHGNPGDRKLEHGMLLIDYGMVLNGYCSDITRTFHIGEWDKEMAHIYSTVLQAETEAIRQVKVGMTFEEVDAIARNIIKEAGFGEYFIHRLGHGLGLDVHEYPSLSAGNTDTVKEGMVFSVEPGIYIPGQGGVRIEDCVVIGAEGAQPLTNFPKELKDVILHP